MQVRQKMQKNERQKLNYTNLHQLKHIFAKMSIA
jgi:hypothetical protein